MEPAVRRVDHIVAFAADAPGLFGLLADGLQLPVVWPMLAFGGYVSGGVSVGNLNVEVTPAGEPAGAQWRGLVLEPGPIEASLAELDRRGLKHSPPDGYAGEALRGTPDFNPATPPGTRLWRISWLSDLPGPAYVALCDYNYQALQPPAHYAEVLRGRQGGPLSLTGAAEIVLGVSDLAAATARWQALLDPAAPSAPGHWPLGAGPDLRLVSAASDAIQGLTLKVASLDQAEDYLRTHALLGQAGEAELTLAPERVQGLAIKIVEAV